MLMIDGDHSADGIRDDWNAFVEYVAPDGTVLIDDYADPVWPDITSVADQLSTSNGWSPVATPRYDADRATSRSAGESE
jgi:hypothetical protein